jgi:hypothetical protein
MPTKVLSHDEIIKRCKMVLGPLDNYAKKCHEASIKLVRSGKLPSNARVARGFCRNIRSQHSWVVLGDCYEKGNTIIDAVRWSYEGRDPAVDIYVMGKWGDGDYSPHGIGPSIFEWGRPEPPEAKNHVIELKPSPLRKKWSDEAQWFLKLIGPLSAPGWHTLLSRAPVIGWPAGEIIEAAHFHPQLSAYIPIDKLGMLTDLNPSELYRRGPDKTKKGPLR